MTGQASKFTGSIPENYDQCLGPHIFHQYAEDLAERASSLTSGKVLELASGTGIMTRKLRDKLSGDTHIVASDLNPPMLAVAQSKFPNGESVEFQQADALDLPFEDGVFDLVLCQFWVMFFPDKVKGYSEAARVLKPGGRYIFNVWGSMAENPFSEVTHDAVAKYFPDDPPGFYKVPFGYLDQDQIMVDMGAGGLTNVSCEEVAFEKEVTDWSLFARGLVYGNPLHDEVVARGSNNSDEIMKSIETALINHFGTAPAIMPLRAKIYSGEAS